MNAEWFKDHICEELDGAEEYIRLAIEIKPMNADWSKELVGMSAAELDHAGRLWKMFDQYHKIIGGAYKVIPDYIEEDYHYVEDKYDKRVECIKKMHEMYSK